MSRTERNKLIYTAVGAPGSGKTESLLAKLPNLLEEGHRIVLALPTLLLSDDIERRSAKAGIACRLIDHRQGEIVVTSLEDALSTKHDPFIICTQESARQVNPRLFDEWILIIDELPKVVDYPDYPVKPSELGRILEYTEERDGQLYILPGSEELVRDQVTTNRAAAKGAGCSTLGNSAAHIFRMLLSGVDVFIDEPQANEKRHIRAVEEFSSWWPILSAATKVHILAANIEKSEFEQFAKINGFHFETSELTPPSHPNLNRVTLYPVLPQNQIFSRGLMESKYGEERLIDITLSMVIRKTESTPLLFANKWAGFENTPGVHYLKKDSRGLNNFSHIKEAIVLFGGNPSPSDRLGLAYLKEKYNQDFQETFITSRLLEPSLQAVTRSAVRCHDQSQNIRLYVQDYRVVDYLLATYFPGATVDWSLSKEVPIKRDGRRLDQAMEEKIIHLLSLGISKAEINRQTGVSRAKLQRMQEAHLAA